jgi:DNA-binding NtrC family response regulator
VASPDALSRLVEYDWPGNVRELENTIERLVLTTRGHEITSDDVQFGAPVEPRPARAELQTRMFEGLPTLDDLERRYLMHVLEAVGGNRTRAAEALGMID